MRDGLHSGQKKRLSLVSVLHRHWLSYLQDTGTSESTFAIRVRENYEGTIAEHARTVEWSQHQDAFSRVRRDTEKVHRWFDDEVSSRFPVEMLDAFVSAFPPDRRDALCGDIFSRLGYLPVRRPEFSTPVDNVGRVLKEVGEALVSLSPVMADNEVNSLDVVHVPHALLQVEEAMAALWEVHARMKSVLV